VRMNTASEKVLRRRFARGPTLLYDLRFRRKYRSLCREVWFSARPPCVEDPLPGVETCSIALTNGLFNASNHDILLIAQDTRGDDEQSAQNCRIMFST
jgi:hypothetical protein